MMRGVQRTVAVFNCYTPDRPSLTLQEIADRIHLAKSTTFRIVQSLEQAGYLIRLEDQKYCLSFRFTRLAGMVMSTLSIRQVARPLLFELARQTNETVTLNIANGRDRTCIDVIDTPSPLMSLARPGQSLLLANKGATDKTLIAHLPQDELQKIVGHLTKGNARKRAEMLRELAQVRKDGYCVSHGERFLGLTAIAAPIWDDSDSSHHCVTIAAPTVRVEPRIDEFLKLLLRTTSDISRRFGADSIQTTTRSPPARSRKTANRTGARRVTGSTGE